MRQVHIIGAGLAGLSAAVHLADKGASVHIYEQAARAGGRARSFHDALLDCTIDNGNHLLLSGNYSALGYLDIINARNRLTGPGLAQFDFLDLETKQIWSVNLNRGPVPLWTLYEDRRVPGTKLRDYLAGLKLLTAGNRSVKQLFADQRQMYRRFWEPFSIAVLNTHPDEAVARLLLPVIRETLAKGADYAEPLIAKHGLSHCFVDPALKWLKQRRSEIRFSTRVSGFDTDNDRISAIRLSARVIPVEEGDGVILAVPATAAQAMLPEITGPDVFAPIVNVHFRLDQNAEQMMSSPIKGLIGGTAQWVFTRGNIASVTISAADDIVDKPAPEIAAATWPEVSLALGSPDLPMPPVRVIKERRATFAATTEQLALRPKPKTAFNNLVLAGDWIDTGLPATIEGAIRSGENAAQILLADSR